MKTKLIIAFLIIIATANAHGGHFGRGDGGFFFLGGIVAGAVIEHQYDREHHAYGFYQTIEENTWVPGYTIVTHSGNQDIITNIPGHLERTSRVIFVQQN